MAIFSEFWIFVTVAFFVLGSITGQQTLTALAVLVFAAGGVARIWSRWALVQVEFERELSDHRAFLGETVEMTFRLTNRKPMPLHWVQVREEVPYDLPVPDAAIESAAAPGRVYVARSSSLAWYERIHWRHTIECRQRGYYRIGPTRIRSSDLFGFFPVEKLEPKVEYLLVYPRTVEISEPPLPFKRPYGEVQSRERIFEDPSRIMGLRDHRPEDPLKHIDWKATARRGSLQVRQFEPTVALNLIIVVNINTLERAWEGYIPELLEGVITTAASLARYGAEARWAVGLYANGSFPQSDLPIRIRPSRDRRQLLNLLEALAVIIPMATVPIEDVLYQERQRLPVGATIGVVTALATDSFWLSVEAVRASGHRIAILWVGERLPECPVPGVTIHLARDFMRV